MIDVSDRRLLICAVLLNLGYFFCPSTGLSGGFTVPENTVESLSKGGTGAAIPDGPAALYFNPALLVASPDHQLTATANIIDSDISFEPDSPEDEMGSRASNKAGPFPVPFLAYSTDLGTERLGFGVGLFGPHAVGAKCFGAEGEDGCEPDRSSPARHMLVESNIIEAFGAAGLGGKLPTDFGTFSAGLTGMVGYQRSTFSTYIDTDTPLTPDQIALFEAKNLTDWTITGMLGLAYAYEGIHLGASYRPPINWESEGKTQITFPEELDDLGPNLTDDSIVFKTKEAGILRVGAGYAVGNPVEARPNLSTLDLEMNFVWEDWSRVNHFEFEPQGELAFTEIEGSQSNFPLNDTFQSKGYEDTYSLRFGTGYTPTDWLHTSAGAFLETAAQPEAYTSADFASWRRLGAGLGVTWIATEWLDVQLGYAHVFQPSRDVNNGKVYAQAPVNPCRGPNYQNDACEDPGTPPTDVQNEGDWTSSFDMLGIGIQIYP